MSFGYLVQSRRGGPSVWHGSLPTSCGESGLCSYWISTSTIEGFTQGNPAPWNSAYCFFKRPTCAAFDSPKGTTKTICAVDHALNLPTKRSSWLFFFKFSFNSKKTSVSEDGNPSLQLMYKSLVVPW